MSRATIGLRELKQNPSEVVSRAEAGTQFDVLRNGKATDVVIERRSPARQRWVSADALRQSFSEVVADTTGWLVQNDALRNDDPLVDPWSGRQ